MQTSHPLTKVRFYALVCLAAWAVPAGAMADDPQATDESSIRAALQEYRQASMGEIDEDAYKFWERTFTGLANRTAPGSEPRLVMLEHLATIQQELGKSVDAYGTYLMLADEAGDMRRYFTQSVAFNSASLLAMQVPKLDLEPVTMRFPCMSW
jgi:hypothetical protein